MFCTNCGAQLSNDSKFCTKCGGNMGTKPPFIQPDPTQPGLLARQTVISKWKRPGFSSMNKMEKVYFISAWVVAAAALLAVLFTIIGRANFDNPGPNIARVIFEIIFLGLTGVFTLLFLSGWFTNRAYLFYLTWVVAALALLTLILVPIGYGGLGAYGAIIAGDFFLVLFLGIFCTILLLYQSQYKLRWFAKNEQIFSTAPVDVNCPECGSATVIRTSKKGPNVGRSFYLCSRYPGCKGKVAIEN
jgi:predicted RNA-binding Zn-ribbon protein involved in translation (DUF1610 family)